MFFLSNKHLLFIALAFFLRIFSAVHTLITLLWHWLHSPHPHVKKCVFILNIIPALDIEYEATWDSSIYIHKLCSASVCRMFRPWSWRAKEWELCEMWRRLHGIVCKNWEDVRCSTLLWSSVVVLSSLLLTFSSLWWRWVSLFGVSEIGNRLLMFFQACWLN